MEAPFVAAPLERSRQDNGVAPHDRPRDFATYSQIHTLPFYLICRRRAVRFSCQRKTLPSHDACFFDIHVAFAQVLQHDADGGVERAAWKVGVSSRRDFSLAIFEQAQQRDDAVFLPLALGLFGEVEQRCEVETPAFVAVDEAEQPHVLACDDVRPRIDVGRRGDLGCEVDDAAPAYFVFAAGQCGVLGHGEFLQDPEAAPVFCAENAFDVFLHGVETGTGVGELV
jgi:hypothetical protein